MEARCKVQSKGDGSTYDPVRARRIRLKDRYGISPEEYEVMLEDQRGVCAICQRPPGSVRLAVDHAHRRARTHGKRESVRGLLCWSCNYWLVRKGVTPDMLRRAANYLEAPPAPAILGTDHIPPNMTPSTPVDNPGEDRLEIVDEE